jgi:hypothetical protein
MVVSLMERKVFCARSAREKRGGAAAATGQGFGMTLWQRYWYLP